MKKIYRLSVEFVENDSVDGIEREYYINDEYVGCERDLDYVLPMIMLKLGFFDQLSKIDKDHE